MGHLYRYWLSLSPIGQAYALSSTWVMAILVVLES